MVSIKKGLMLLGLGLVISLPSQAFAADDYGYYDNDTNTNTDNYGYYDSEEVLQPPDVTFYASLEAARTDLGNLGGEKEHGFTLQAGAYFNDIHWQGLRYAVEAGYTNFGETDRVRTQYFNTRGELNDIVDYPVGLTPLSNKGSITREEKVDLSMLNFGTRIEARFFYLRLGGALYSYHHSNETSYVFIDPNDGHKILRDPPSISHSKSGLAPYLGVGLNIPLLDHLNLAAGYTTYLVNSQHIDGVRIGLRYID